MQFDGLICFFVFADLSALRRVEVGGGRAWWSVRGRAARDSTTTTATSWRSRPTWSSAICSRARAPPPGTAAPGSRYDSTNPFPLCRLSASLRASLLWVDTVCAAVSSEPVLSVFLAVRRQKNAGFLTPLSGPPPTPAHPHGPSSGMVLIRTKKNTRKYAKTHCCSTTGINKTTWVPFWAKAPIKTYKSGQCCPTMPYIS